MNKQAEEKEAAKRAAGVLLPLSALPSRHGVGDMGVHAMRLIELLQQSNVSYWQILPIHPLGFGNSPYQPYSSIAGDPLFISLDTLVAEGFLSDPPADFQPHAVSVDYVGARAFKEEALRKAFKAFTITSAYQAFIQKPWVRPFAIFMAFKKANQMRCWLEWPEEQRNWPLPKVANLSMFEEEIQYQMFAQFIFDSQWKTLKRYANERGVRIIGDMPIYVGLDSLDVWANRENFLLDAHGQPTSVAGVPPDYFSSTGQRWGNPLYDWDFMKANGFHFWLDRLRDASELFDTIRIDHFRGFDTYWKIPADCPTAEIGEWMEAPGYALFDAIFKEMPGLVLIAEDLGLLREEVYALRDHYALPGMKVLQFTFVPGARIALDHHTRMVIYTGTHDNQTTTGWYRSMRASKRLLTQMSLWRGGYRFGCTSHKFIRLALHDSAELAVISAQDLMCLSDEARINTPGTVGSPNWEWKLSDLSSLEKGLRFFQKAIKESGRAAPHPGAIEG